jgi:hypothetical protein
MNATYLTHLILLHFPKKFHEDSDYEAAKIRKRSAN